MAPIHLQPTAALAERVLLPGDPGRALLLAQSLIDAPLMFNHHRGLWGYTGAALIDGEPLTVQSTGMGGPSAAIVIEELIALGVKDLIRVGTCGSLTLDLRLGDVLVADAALAEDGTSRTLGAGDVAPADPLLTGRLRTAAGGARAGTVASTDLFYSRAESDEAAARARWRAGGALAVEMEAATLFTLARVRAARAGCVLAVSDELEGPADRERIGEDALRAAGERIGAIAVAALAAGA